MKPPKGPTRQIMGAASEFYGIWKFAKNQEAAKEFLTYYTDNWLEAFKASAGYNNAIFANIVPKPMPILSNDPTSNPHDKLAMLQTSDEWSAIPGYPGPAWAATDEIYNNFTIPDMMAKTASGSMSAEEVGQVGDPTVRGHRREVGRKGLIAGARTALSLAVRIIRHCRLSASRKVRMTLRPVARGRTLNFRGFDGCSIDQKCHQEIW